MFFFPSGLEDFSENLKKILSLPIESGIAVVVKEIFGVTVGIMEIISSSKNGKRFEEPARAKCTITRFFKISLLETNVCITTKT